MNKILLLPALILASQCVPVAHSQPRATGAAVSVTPRLGYWHYREIHNSREVMRQQMPMAGAVIAARLILNDVIDMVASGEIQSGVGVYVGSAQNLLNGEVTPLTMAAANTIFQPGLMLRASFVIPQSQIRVGVGIGYAYRHLIGHNMPREPIDYTRVIQQHFIPLQLTVETPLGRRVRIHLSAEYRQMLYGRVTTHMNELNLPVRLPTIENSQSDGEGVAIELGVTVPTRTRYSLRIAPYYRYLHVADSNIATASGLGFLEPENELYEAGVGVSFDFDLIQ